MTVAIWDRSPHSASVVIVKLWMKIWRKVHINIDGGEKETVD